MNDAILSWQESQWCVLQQRKTDHKLPHALLLTGISGIGKHSFAMQLAQSVLCSRPDEKGFACLQCKNCQLLAANTHADFIEISPEEAGKAIKIDQIRQLIQTVDKTAQQGGFKVIMIRPADAMNINAANAILKTLEEPTQNTLIILITERLMALSPTVRSRCQMIHFPVPERQVALDWLIGQSLDCSKDEMLLALSLANGAPLKVLDFIANDELTVRKEIFNQWLEMMRGKLSIIDLASKWQKMEFNQLYLHWNSWIADIVRLQNSESSDSIVNYDVKEILEKVSKHCDSKKVYFFLDELNKMHNVTQKHISLNAQLMLEDLIIKNRDILA